VQKGTKAEPDGPINLCADRQSPCEDCGKKHPIWGIPGSGRQRRWCRPCGEKHTDAIDTTKRFCEVAKCGKVAKFRLAGDSAGRWCSGACLLANSLRDSKGLPDVRLQDENAKLQADVKRLKDRLRKLGEPIPQARVKPVKKKAKPGRPLPGRSKKEKKAPTDAPAAAVAEEVASSGSRSSKRVIKK
jgi:hypothetical protein